MATIPVVLSPAQVAANTTAEQVFNLPAGYVFPPFAVAGAGLVINKPTAQAGLGIVGARFVTPGSFGVTFSNNTAAPITPTAGESYSVTAVE